jgi:hypothetical protein
MRALSCLILCLSLCGCGLFESPAQRAMRNSPDYKAGYSDGCASASTSGANPRDTSLVRDEEAYRTIPAYRSGWGTGFNGCRLYQPSAGLPVPGRGPVANPF